METEYRKVFIEIVKILRGVEKSFQFTYIDTVSEYAECISNLCKMKTLKSLNSRDPSTYVGCRQILCSLRFKRFSTISEQHKIWFPTILGNENPARQMDNS